MMLVKRQADNKLFGLKVIEKRMIKEVKHVSRCVNGRWGWCGVGAGLVWSGEFGAWEVMGGGAMTA